MPTYLSEHAQRESSEQTPYAPRLALLELAKLQRVCTTAVVLRLVRVPLLPLALRGGRVLARRQRLVKLLFEAYIGGVRVTQLHLERSMRHVQHAVPPPRLLQLCLHALQRLARVGGRREQRRRLSPHVARPPSCEISA
jgi:hypothetical protein